jgi:hypothetical protein
MEDNTNNFNLELGYIIQIISPTNSNLHNKTFFIDYLDNNFIKIIDTNDFTETKLSIINGQLTEKTITSIYILYRPEVKGYARQNQLTPNKWVEIHIGGDIPTILIGIITDLEEDSIEIKLYPNNELIYLNFDYKGIPIDIPIQKIILREPPTQIIKTTEDTDISFSITDSPTISKQQLTTDLQNIFAEGDAIFEDIDISITEDIEVPEYQKRFDIKTQTNDLLDDLLSTIPNDKRTFKVLNNIHTLINRFVQLRNSISIKDTNDIITGYKIIDQNHKPLIDKLFNLNTKLYWILPVVKNIKSLQYDGSIDKEDTVDFIINPNNFENDIFNILENYYNNNIPVGINPYDYLLNNINSSYENYKLPFDTTNILHNSNVNTSIDVLIDNIVINMKDFYSSVVYNSDIKNQRFVIANYGLGFNKLNMNIIRNKILNTNIVNATPNDPIAIDSIITLPDSYIKYSNISLPNTSIYEKTNLNHISFNYYNLLKQNLSITKKEINNLDDPFDNKDFFNKITQFILDKSINDSDKYRKFLELIIPRTKDLFNIVSKYITYNTSYYNVINYLQPFLIYKDDITFMQYKTISDYLNNSISNLYKTISINEIESNKLRKLKLNIKFNSFILINILDTYSNIINTDYNINNSNLTSTELLNRIINIDNAAYYFSLISDLNKSLISDINISEFIDNIQSQQLDLDISKQNIINKCKNLVLVKKYTSYDSLIADNDISNVNVDLQYDQTNYDILELYQTEKSTMNPDEFKDFLRTQLIESGNITDDYIDEELTALLNGYKLVKDGDYALLINYDDEENVEIETKIFKRENNNWNYDVLLTNEFQEVPIDEIPLYFCNKNPKQLVFKDTITEQSNKTKQDLIKEQTELLFNKFDDLELESSSKIKQNIIEQIKFNKQSLVRILEYTYKLKFFNNNKLYNIGINFINSISDVVIHSPFTIIRDNILSITDLNNKYTYINKFINKFTRTNYDNEDPNWYYCIETNTKLLPTFYKDLADGFFSNNYLNTIDDICNLRGEISDDKDAWIDKHSGYIITVIDYVDEEQYNTAGFKVISNEIMEKQINTDELQLNEESKMINTIINTILQFSGIKQINIHEFVINLVLNVKPTIILTEELYNKQVDILKQKGKKVASYDDYYYYRILLLTTASFLIAVQTEPIYINIKKSMPGCISSISGYPTENNDDFSGLDYLICILKKISNDNKPWNTIKSKRVTPDKIKSLIISFIDKVIIDNIDVKNRIQIKKDFLKNVSNTDIITSFNNNWNTFLPPLKQIKTGSINNVTPAFIESLNTDIKTGSLEQIDKINIIKSKIFYYSFEIIKSIENIVNKETTLLNNKSGIPYIENFCCNNSKFTNVLDFFKNKDKKITIYSDIITNLYNTINTINNYSKSPILHNNTDTKLKYPSLKKEFDEKTIYLAFIMFCKFNKDLPINKNLLPICLDNTSSFNFTDTIEDKIKILKSENRNFNNESLLLLLNIVNRENIIHLQINKPIITIKQVFENTINFIKDNTEDIIEDDIINKFTELIDTTYLNKSVNIDIYDNIRRLIIDKTFNYKNIVKNFIKNNKIIKTSSLNKLINFIDTIEDFEKYSSSSLLNNDEENTLYIITYLYNCMFDMINVFPYIILNNVYKNDISIPQYWNLSSRHNNDIKTFIGNFYNQFDNNNSFNIDLFDNIKPKLDILYQLINNIPFISSSYIKNKLESSIFDSLFVKELYIFYFFKVLSIYIDIIEVSKEQVIYKNPEDDVEQETKDIIVSKLIISFLNIFYNYKNKINYSPETINNKVFKTRDIEKECIKTTLQRLSDDERKVDNLFKSAGLGRWNLGLQKAVTQYTKDGYDENNGVWTIENEEHLTFDESEAYNMSDIPEDDDIGEEYNYPYNQQLID